MTGNNMIIKLLLVYIIYILLYVEIVDFFKYGKSNTGNKLCI
jgi:hypothetical protein